jgi:hypothetical protein
MPPEHRENYLKLALRVCGAGFLLIYPMSLIWPAGIVWHGGEGAYYFQMLLGIYAVLGVFLLVAASRPLEHRSLIWFTVWSSVVHALIMTAQALGDPNETAHLYGDIPILLLVAAVLGLLMPRRPATG